MATEAATGQPANVQAYLTKHSISTLFEDLTSLLVKELPDNPVDFLILKLQARKKKTTGTTSRSVTGPKKLDVTGTAAPKTERGKPAARPSSVKPSTASGTTKPTRPTSSTTSRPTTTKPSSGSSSKPTTTSTTKDRSTVTKSAPTTTTTSKVTKPTSGVKPPTSTSGIKKPTTSKPSSATGTKTGSSTAAARKPVKSGTTGIPTKGGATPNKGGATPTKGGATPTKSITPSDSPAVARKATKPVATSTVTEAPPTQEIIIPTVDIKREEEEEEKEVAISSKVTYNDSEEEEEEDNVQQQKDAPVELNQLISQLKRSKNPNKQDKSHLTALINARQSGISEGYISDNEEEDEDQLEVAENIDALKEEGVELTGDAKKISIKAPTVGPNVDLQVLICARCAKVLSRDEETVTVSSSVLQSMDDLESASQVASSQTSYPQWDTDESGSMTVKQKWAAVSSTGPVGDEGSSSVSSSHDTWKGLAPVSRDAEGPSDQDSELQLPQPVNYHKPDEDTTATEKDESSLIED